MPKTLIEDFIPVRIEPVLYRKLKRLAKKEKSSVIQQLDTILRKALK